MGRTHFTIEGLHRRGELPHPVAAIDIDAITIVTIIIVIVGIIIIICASQWPFWFTDVPMVSRPASR